MVRVYQSRYYFLANTSRTLLRNSPRYGWFMALSGGNFEQVSFYIYTSDKSPANKHCQAMWYRNRKYIKCLVGYDFSQTLLIIFNLTFQYYIYFYVVQKHFNKSIPTNIPEKLFFQSFASFNLELYYYYPSSIEIYDKNENCYKNKKKINDVLLFFWIY